MFQKWFLKTQYKTLTPKINFKVFIFDFPMSFLTKTEKNIFHKWFFKYLRSICFCLKSRYILLKPKINSKVFIINLSKFSVFLEKMRKNIFQNGF